LAIKPDERVSSMNKHPKTSSEALHPSDFKGDKSGSSNAGRQGAYGQSSKGR
jgi:hypothetical protein